MIDQYLRANQSRALELFREFDKEGKGHLNAKQAARLVERLLPGSRERDVRYFLAMVDLDRDNKVTYRNLADAVKEARDVTQGVKQRRRAAFAAVYRLRDAIRGKETEARRLLETYDIDSSGSLEVDELAVLLRELCPGLSSGELRYIVANAFHFDADSDGRISLEDLCSCAGLEPSRLRRPDPSTPAPGEAHEEAASQHAVEPLHLQARHQPLESEEGASTQPRAMGHEQGGDANMLSDNLQPKPDNPEKEETDAQHELVCSPAPVHVREEATQVVLSEQVDSRAGKRSSKADLVQAMREREEFDARLRSAVRAAQRTLSSEVDRLRRDLENVQSFSSELETLIANIESRGGVLKQQVEKGFQEIRNFLDEREKALLTQADEVAMGRLGAARNQWQRAGAVKESMEEAVRTGDEALQLEDPKEFLQAESHFENRAEQLKADGSYDILSETAGSDSLDLAFDAESIKPHLQKLLVFRHSSELGEEQSSDLFSAGSSSRLAPIPRQKVAFIEAFFSVAECSGDRINPGSLRQVLSSDGRVTELFQHKEESALRHESMESLLAEIERRRQGLDLIDLLNLVFKNEGEEPGEPAAHQEQAAQPDPQQGSVQSGEHASASAEREAREQTEIKLREVEDRLHQAEREKGERERQLEQELERQRQEADEQIRNLQEEHRLQQEQFEQRLQSALERSEAALSGQQRPQSIDEPKERKKVGPAGFRRPKSAGARGSPPDTEVRAPLPQDPHLFSLVNWCLRSERGQSMASQVAERISRPPPPERPYNGRGVTRDDRTAFPTRLKAAGERMRNRGV